MKLSNKISTNARNTLLIKLLIANSTIFDLIIVNLELRDLQTRQETRSRGTTNYKAQETMEL